MHRLITRYRRRIGLATGIHLRLKRYTASASDGLRLAKLINHKGIDCVVDIGANKGQFAEQLFDFGYKGRVISFEPTIEAHKLLEAKAKKNNNWIIAKRCAIGDEKVTTKINVSYNSVFSSILQINKNQIDNAASSGVDHTEEVEVFPLDDVIANYIDVRHCNLLLKIDTQGYEYQVLMGAKATLEHVKGLAIEIPLFHIYEGVAFDFYSAVNWLKQNGFYPYSFKNEGVNYSTGRVNTIDGVFFK